MNLLRRLWRVLTLDDAREDYAAAHEDFEAIKSYLEMLARAIDNPGVPQERLGKRPKDTSDLVGGTQSITWQGFGQRDRP